MSSARILEEWFNWKINTQKICKENKRMNSQLLKFKLPIYLLSLLSLFFAFVQSTNNEKCPPFRDRTGVPLTCSHTEIEPDDFMQNARMKEETY